MKNEMYKGVVYKYTCPENKIYIGTTIKKKVVLKLDVNGNIIKELPSINDAAKEAGVNRITMVKYLNGESNGYLKTPYRWRKKYGK